MKNFHITEIMSEEETYILSSESAIIDLIDAISENKKINNFYFHDSDYKYCGMIEKKELIEYISPYAFSIDRTVAKNFREKLSLVSVKNIIDNDFPVLGLNSSFTEVAVTLVSDSVSAVPVLNSMGELIGEVNIDSVLREISICNSHKNVLQQV